MAHDILIVDDEKDIRELIAGILQDEGYNTRVAADSDQAILALGARKPNIVILDIWLQGSRLDGLEVLDLVISDYPGLPVIVISGHGTIETAVAAIKKGAYDFLEKPFKSDRLLVQVTRAIESAKLKRENEELRLKAGGAGELIGSSGGINAIRQAIEKIAPTNSRVLISGPPGSGKELTARLLHLQSRRTAGPFIVANAARLEPGRMEIELFGAEGGEGRKIGLLEAAHGGTLFIDEVADMPLETQAKILRVLVEQSFERVGGQSKVQVDVRIVSATSRDLHYEIESGRFRQDLFHRLNVTPLRVPSLKERREDIPQLIDYFMRREAEALGLAPSSLTEDAVAVLQTCDWPGNVRELRNLAARLLILAPGGSGGIITADMLPTEVSNPVALRPDSHVEMMTLPLREAREIFEREYLLAQISRFGGNISRTAAFVGMERSALHRKLKLLGVGGNEKATAESS